MAEKRVDGACDGEAVRWPGAGARPQDVTGGGIYAFSTRVGGALARRSWRVYVEVDVNLCVALHDSGFASPAKKLIHPMTATSSVTVTTFRTLKSFYCLLKEHTEFTMLPCTPLYNNSCHWMTSRDGGIQHNEFPNLRIFTINIQPAPYVPSQAWSNVDRITCKLGREGLVCFNYYSLLTKIHKIGKQIFARFI